MRGNLQLVLELRIGHTSLAKPITHPVPVPHSLRRDYDSRRRRRLVPRLCIPDGRAVVADDENHADILLSSSKHHLLHSIGADIIVQTFSSASSRFPTMLSLRHRRRNR